jgi:hypothetical protein
MEKREAFRFAAELAAECRSCGRSWITRLSNISSTGCMVECAEAGLPDGALVRVRLKGLTAIDGTIVWQHRGHAGIRFLEPLHVAVMEYLGFRQPEPTQNAERPAEIRPAPRRPASGLDAQLVKRSWGEEARPRIAAGG